MGSTPILSPESLRDRIHARLPDAISDLRALAKDHAPESVRTREAGYTIQNAASDEAVVRIYDEIWWLGINALDLVADLDAITAPSIRVEINSPGGDVFDGIAIYNALRNHPAYVTTRVDGLAASISSVIAQAGDKRLVQPSAQIMIHNAWGMVVGDTKDHAEMSTLLEQQDGVIANIYAARAKRPVARFRELMNAETWLTAEMAVDEGLADGIIDPPAKKEPAAKATLLDEISNALDGVLEAVSSTERVVALRADAGKDLSNQNRERLVGLHDAVVRLENLLTPTPNDDTERWIEDDIATLRALIDSRSINVPFS